MPGFSVPKRFDRPRDEPSSGNRWQISYSGEHTPAPPSEQRGLEGIHDVGAQESLTARGLKIMGAPNAPTEVEEVCASGSAVTPKPL